MCGSATAIGEMLGMLILIVHALLYQSLHRWNSQVPAYSNTSQRMAVHSMRVSSRGQGVVLWVRYMQAMPP